MGEKQIIFLGKKLSLSLLVVAVLATIVLIVIYFTTHRPLSNTGCFQLSEMSKMEFG